MATLAGFVTFLRDVAGITTVYLPDNSPAIPTAYAFAKEIVSLQIEQASCIMYDAALYNLGTDYIINWAPDQAGQTYFKDLRADYTINDFVAGVISSTSDESTGESLLVPDAFKTFTLADLQNLKTPFGRQYLAIAQRIGTLWGLS